MRKIWTEEKILEDAKKYTYPTDWQKKSVGAYNASRRHKIHSQATAHMIRKHKVWTKEKVIEDAKKYTSIKEWLKNSPSAYDASQRYKVHSQATAHMIGKGKWWTNEEIIAAAKKYTSRKEWEKNSSGMYAASLRYKIHDLATAHMPGRVNQWTNEEVITDAKLYSSRSEWSKNSIGYEIARRRNILDVACKHMTPKGNRYKRQIYAIENGDRSVYVGLSYNPESRYKAHVKHNANHPCSKILFKHYTNGTQKLRIFEPFYSQQEVRGKEDEYIEKYRNDGWIILNTAKAGSLGSSKTKYTREYCVELAKGFVDKKSFRLKHSLVYHSMHKNGWLDLISHLLRRKPKHLYTDEEMQTAALQCKTRGEFYRRFPKYYRSAINHGIFEKITRHLPSKHKNKRTKININYCVFFAESHNGKCLSNKYLNKQTPLEWSCKRKHLWILSLDAMKKRIEASGTFCLLC